MPKRMSRATKVAIAVGAGVLAAGGAAAYVLLRGGKSRSVSGDVLLGDPTVVTSDPAADCGAGCYLTHLLNVDIGTSGDAAGRN